MPENFADFVFSIGTIDTQRFLLSLERNSSSEFYEKTIEAFFTNFFTAKSCNINDKDVMHRIAIGDAGVPQDIVEKCLSEIKKEEIKTILKENTKRVVDLGGFGLPITLLHTTTKNKPEWIFGSDRLHLIGYLLGEDSPPILRE